MNSKKVEKYSVHHAFMLNIECALKNTNIFFNAIPYNWPHPASAAYDAVPDPRIHFSAAPSASLRQPVLFA